MKVKKGEKFEAKHDHAEFECDAKNGLTTGLSWTKMRYEMDMRIPRTIVDKEYCQFPICTEIGGLG